MGEDNGDLFNSDGLRDAKAYIQRKDEASNTSV